MKPENNVTKIEGTTNEVVTGNRQVCIELGEPSHRTAREGAAANGNRASNVRGTVCRGEKVENQGSHAKVWHGARVRARIRQGSLQQGRKGNGPE